MGCKVTVTHSCGGGGGPGFALPTLAVAGVALIVLAAPVLTLLGQALTVFFAVAGAGVGLGAVGATTYLVLEHRRSAAARREWQVYLEDARRVPLRGTAERISQIEG